MRFLLVAALLIAAGATRGVAHAGAGQTASPNSDLDRSVVVSETPAELQLPLDWWWPYGAGADVCLLFFVHGVGQGARSVLVTTTGLGRSQLEIASNREASNRCTTSTWKPLLWLPLVGKSGTWLRLRVPKEAFPPAGSTASGKLRIIASSRSPYEVELSLATPGPSPFWTALVWIVGLIVPAFIAWQVFVNQEARKAANQESANFENYKATNVAKLEQLFRFWFPAIIANTKNDRHWRSELLTGLNDDGILAALPAEMRARLMRVLGTGTTEHITDELTAAFPVWESYMRPNAGAS